MAPFDPITSAVSSPKIGGGKPIQRGRRGDRMKLLLHLLTWFHGTSRTSRDVRLESAKWATADIQPTSPNDRVGPEAVIRSIHATCLSPLVTDRAMEAWYHPSIA
jgi:hypothetical protein